MANNFKRKLTLDRPVVYQIEVFGNLDSNWLDWIGEISVEVSSEDSGWPITTLTGNIDQAALIGLLRRLYSLGLPLVSVNCLEVK